MLRTSPMNLVEERKEPTAGVSSVEPTIAMRPAAKARGGSTRWTTLLAFPAATAVALVVHLGVSQKELPAETRLYTQFLVIVLAAALLVGALERFWAPVRRWIREISPIVAVAMFFLAVWEVITAGLHLLPMPYFPSPAGVLQSLASDRAMLFDSTWHSLLLLLGGYALGVVTGLITGICIGWFRACALLGNAGAESGRPDSRDGLDPARDGRSPNALFSAVGLIALAVWFPVTMLTASGISNTRASYLDVARTLGAGRAYLIFRVAIPGGDAEHLHRPVHGTRRVVPDACRCRDRRGEIRPGLVHNGAGRAEYGKVTRRWSSWRRSSRGIMTLLFKLRDRVLVWQKGVIRW